MPVQIRAYKVDADSPYGGQTIDELEAPYEGRLQIESVYRDGVELELKQSLTVFASDVIVVLGPIRDIDLFDDDGLTETTEEEYVSFEMARLEIVVSEKRAERILDKLSDKGIMINRILRKGKEIAFSDTTAAEKGDILSVSGRPQTILKTIEDIGYVKELPSCVGVPVDSVRTVGAVRRWNVPGGSPPLGKPAGAFLRRYHTPADKNSAAPPCKLDVCPA